ncbi:MAG: hypothetical protein JXR48_11425 [Candidatus Delongbacteria bacterium]|nr:hypothetical protein [Candidatus Delongbacteria bacterium]MBN2835563.1 hypothetical protein [Candidatus Delongbacteria bacterium]
MRLLFFVMLIISAYVLKADYRSGDNDLLLQSTAETIPKGMASFSSTELIFMEYTFAPTNTTNVSVHTLFPITTELIARTFTVSAKHKIFDNEKTKLALTLTFTPNNTIISGGGILTVKGEPGGFNLGAFAVGGEEMDEFSYLTTVGLFAKTGDNSSILGEFYFSPSDEDWMINALMIGFKLQYEKLSWNFGGFRPLKGNMGDILFYPYIRASYLIE